MLLIAQKRLRTQVRKEQITQATEKIILRFGSENVTLRQIAEEVGISAGAIYRHFDSKDAIFSFLLKEISENLLGQVNKGLIINGRITDYLHYTFMNHILNIHRDHAISFQIISEVISFGNKKLNKQLKGIINDYLTYIKNLLVIGVRTGEIREDIDLDSAAMLFFSMMESISNYWILIWKKK
jgi:TetR/AcrR family transcriptional regulator